MQFRIYRHSMARFYGHQDLEDLDHLYTSAWFDSLRAHGFNAFWLNVWMRRLVSFREPDTAEQLERQSRLNRLIARADRHGVGVWLFLNEPKAFPRSHRMWQRFPQMRGAPGKWCLPPIETFLLCTSTPEGKDYMYESARRLHQVAPGLAGTFHINAAEFPTHCYCHTIANPKCTKVFSSDQEHLGVDCPRCAERSPEEVVAEIVNLYLKGCRDAGSAAPVVAWSWDWVLYAQDPQEKLISLLDPGVILMADFECGGQKTVLGRDTAIDEYSLIYPGPSPAYSGLTECARNTGHAHAAKLQIGATHEMGTVANMPLLRRLAHKVQFLRQTGTQGFLATWNFASRFTLNSATVGLCVHAKRPLAPAVAIARVAKAHLGIENAASFCAVIDAIERAFDSYPISNRMMHRGPLNYALAYPLDGRPIQGKSLPPTYFVGEFGDAWEECCGPFTMEQVIAGLDRMAAELRPAVEGLDALLFPGRSPRESCLQDYTGPAAIPNDCDRLSPGEEADYMCGVLPPTAFEHLPALATPFGVQRLKEWCNAWYLLGSVESSHRILLNHAAKRDGHHDYGKFLRDLQRGEVETLRTALIAVRLDARLGFHGECQTYLAPASAIVKKLEALRLDMGCCRSGPKC